MGRPRMLLGLRMAASATMMRPMMPGMLKAGLRAVKGMCGVTSREGRGYETAP